MQRPIPAPIHLSLFTFHVSPAGADRNDPAHPHRWRREIDLPGTQLATKSSPNASPSLFSFNGSDDGGYGDLGIW